MSKAFEVGDVVRVWIKTLESNESETAYNDFFIIKEKATRLDIFTFPRVDGNFYKIEGFMYGKTISNIRESNLIAIKVDDRFVNELLDKLLAYEALEERFKCGTYLEKKKKLIGFMKKKLPKKRKIKNA